MKISLFHLSIFCILCLLLSCDKIDKSYQTWEVYKGGPEANNYSLLDQVNKANVKNLEIAWSFYPNDELEGMRIWKYECNPIVIDGVMYLTSARGRLYAIRAETGEKIWSFDPFDGGRGIGVLRGVTYWEGVGEELIFVAAKNKIFAIDAINGKPVTSFGENGWISLNMSQEGREDQPRVTISTPGIIYGDLLIIGASVSEGADAAPGHVRAFNVHSGKLAWIFHTIPYPGEFGYDTWPEEAYKYIGGTNNWAGMSLDEERGIVYVPTGSPTYDYYAANRTGSNLFGNSLVALNAATGEYIWHFQTVHHDIWDYDLPTAPNLITVKRDGKSIDAVAQPTKMGFIYVLDRETGTPIFPVKERSVPASSIPGETTWPTQPFPVKPKPFARQVITPNDINDDVSDEIHQSNQQTISDLWFRGLFTPLDTKTTLLIPGSRGGGEWGGGAYDLETGILYINSNESPEIGRIEKVRSLDTRGNTLYAAGKKLYNIHCASCHGSDKQGVELNPSLVGIDQRFSDSEIIVVVTKGRGIMPSFGSVLQNNQDELLAFLTETGKQTVVDSSQPQDTSTTYLNVANKGYLLDSLGRPRIKPPWGTMNAIDLNTCKYVWKIPLGSHPDFQKPDEPPTGMENYGGPVVTAGGLVFIAATIDSMFRAFDKESGALLWEVKLPGNGLATPAIYQVNGRQYVTIAVSIGESQNRLSHTKSGIVTFALADE